MVAFSVRMVIGWVLGFSLCWGVSAVLFNDTVGTLPDWEEEGLGQIPVVSGGLEDSPVQTSVLGDMTIPGLKMMTILVPSKTISTLTPTLHKCNSSLRT